MGTLRDDLDELKIQVAALKIELASIRQLAMDARVMAEVAKNTGSFQYQQQYQFVPELEPRRFDAERGAVPEMTPEQIEEAEKVLKLSPFALARPATMQGPSSPKRGVDFGSKAFGEDIEEEEDGRILGG